MDKEIKLKNEEIERLIYIVDIYGSSINSEEMDLRIISKLKDCLYN